MDLTILKEEYKSETINMNNMIGKPESKMSQEDLDQMCEEIDEASTLQEFMDVVSSWSEESIRIGAAMVILKRVVALHDQ
jgi:hypothetical protein